MTRRQVIGLVFSVLSVIMFVISAFFTLAFHPLAGVRTFTGVPFKDLLRPDPLTALLMSPLIFSVIGVVFTIRGALERRRLIPLWLLLVPALPAAYILSVNLIDLFDRY